MYLNSLVRIPDVHGKITISRKRYVMYEIGREYIAKRKYNIPKRVTIGKLAADSENETDPEMMYPTEWFSAYFPGACPENQRMEAARSGCLRIGTVLAVKKILEDEGILLAVKTFGTREAELLLDFSLCVLVNGQNPTEAIEDYFFDHPSISGVSTLSGSQSLNEISYKEMERTAEALIKKWTNKMAQDQRVFLSGEGRTIVPEEWKSKERNKRLEILGIGMKNGLPLFLESSHSDDSGMVKTEELIAAGEEDGLQKIGILFERENIPEFDQKELERKGIPYLMIQEKKAPEIHAGGGKSRKKTATEFFEDMMQQSSDVFFDRWNCIRLLDQAGWEEKAIRGIQEGEYTERLLRLLILLVRIRLEGSGGNTAEKEAGRDPYGRAQAAIRELEKIEMIRYADGIYRVRQGLTGKQRRILNWIGQNETNVLREAEELSRIYSKTEGKRKRQVRERSTEGGERK